LRCGKVASLVRLPGEIGREVGRKGCIFGQRQTPKKAKIPKKVVARAHVDE
jgi:hypothetical protein